MGFHRGGAEERGYRNRGCGTAKTPGFFATDLIATSFASRNSSQQADVHRLIFGYLHGARPILCFEIPAFAGMTKGGGDDKGGRPSGEDETRACRLL